MSKAETMKVLDLANVRVVFEPSGLVRLYPWQPLPTGFYLNDVDALDLAHAIIAAQKGRA